MAVFTSLIDSISGLWQSGAIHLPLFPGGIWPAPPGVQGFVQLFIEVDDMAKHVAKATALGAKVLIPPQTLPQGEEMAILHDPLGMSFGLVKPAGK